MVFNQNLFIQFLEQKNYLNDSYTQYKNKVGLTIDGKYLKSFLNYNVDIKKQEEHLEEFKHLPIEQQKQHLLELLDKNQLYVNLSSLEDKDFACTDEEKKVTKEFYQLNKNK